MTEQKAIEVLTEVSPKKTRWSTKRNDRKNKAICQLMSLGWSAYSIMCLLGETDKRNIQKIFKRDKERFPIIINKE